MAFRTCKRLYKVQGYIFAKPLNFTFFRLFFSFLEDSDKFISTQALLPGFINIFKVVSGALSDPEASLALFGAIYTKKCKIVIEAKLLL